MEGFRQICEYHRDALTDSSILEAEKSQDEVFGQLERMGDEMQMKTVAQAEMQGRRPAGRLRNIWKDVLQRDLEGSGLSLEEPATEVWIVEASCDYNAAGS